MSKQTLLPILFLLSFQVHVFAQDQSGFISLDCGLSRDENYRDSATGIEYISDADYIETGVSKPTAVGYSNGTQKQTHTVRSFPQGLRNCYRFNLSIGDKYLIRANFMYGNYDGENRVPLFDVYIGPNKWRTVNLENESTYFSVELIHVLLSDYLHVCLVNTGGGTPFISSLELRALKNTTYVTQSGSLQLNTRLDIASNASQQIRYKEDVYDRVWTPLEIENTTTLSTDAKVNVNRSNSYNPASLVMQTAATPGDGRQIFFRLNPQNFSNQYYIYMHFAEVQELKGKQIREFNISLNGMHWFGPFSPSYMSTTTVFTPSSLNGSQQNNFAIFQTERSTLPPIINALEVYNLLEFQQLQTQELDVDAITNVKDMYRLVKNWQGDPCVPLAFLWDGVGCVDNGNEPPRIVSLNLSSSGLSGTIADYFSNLTQLQSLDLSNNNLIGSVPDFLCQMSSLKFLNLSGNKLNGSVPAPLLERQRNNSLTLSFGGNPDLCSSDPCNKNNNKKKAVVLAVSLFAAFVFIILAALSVYLVLKKRKQQGSSHLDPMQQNHQHFTYSEVLKMTNNFQRVLGKGGFGTVYYGRLEDTEVAVKIISQSSTEGFKRFKSEVKLLMRVQHRNLTTLIGYCDEGINLALIYEYMVNGNLADHLLGNDNIVSWEMRLRIAAEAAQGLEYLHYGCKPAIIHRDVKSTNVLLNDKLQAKLADFGLSRTFSVEGSTQVSTIGVGTPGYLDPEYLTTKVLTKKSDVYSFGIVLLELITGQSVIPKVAENSNSNIRRLVSFMTAKGDIANTVDPRLQGGYDLNSVSKAVEIAMACVSRTSSRRPTMKEVVVELNECLAMETAWRKERTNELGRGDAMEMIAVNFHEDRGR